jgi:hypothetical protein
MLLPAPVSDLLEQVAHAAGYPDLFRRVRDLAVEIIGLATVPASDPEIPAELARRWLDSLLSEPLPPEVQAALDQTVPRIRELEVLNQGFQLWAESISPQAAEALRALERLADTRSMLVLGVLVARPSRRRGTAKSRPVRS